jgi:hypothetical protein
MMVLGATMSQSLSVASTPSQKRKASQIGGRGNPPRPGPGLAENRVVVSGSDPSLVTTTGRAKPNLKRLKRSFAFYEPLSASKRPNVTQGKQIYSCYIKAEPLTNKEWQHNVNSIRLSRSQGQQWRLQPSRCVEHP